jgi:hypothetical protein
MESLFEDIPSSLARCFRGFAEILPATMLEPAPERKPLTNQVGCCTCSIAAQWKKGFLKILQAKSTIFSTVDVRRSQRESVPENVAIFTSRELTAAASV